MRTELNRQLVHLSGVLFIILAQFIGQIIAAYLLLIAATLFVYSLYVRQEQEKLKLLNRLEKKFRSLAISFERERAVLPFTGAIWFFLALGLSFLVFPISIALAAGLILTVGDGLSALVGTHFGRHRILGDKSLEGSAAFFFGSLTAVLFIEPVLVLPVAFLATLVELLPALPRFEHWRKRGLLDDNWLIPLIVCLFLIRFWLV